LPNTEPSAEPTPTNRPRAHPSLMGASDSASRAGPPSDGGLRMLDNLESAARPKPAVASPAGRRGAWMLLGLVVVAVALGWWSRAGAPTAGSSDMPPAARLADARPAQGAPTQPAEVATARIENTPASAVGEAVAATQLALAAPAAPTAAAATSEAPVQPVAKQAAKPAAVRSTRAAEPPLASPAAAVPAARATKTADADVVLLSALLAHVSRSGQASTLAEQDQLTIAQIVQRCEARGGEEARECRRRICEGYWGKAEACPAPATVAPKKG
jgi:ribosomal protein L40E